MTASYDFVTTQTAAHLATSLTETQEPNRMFRTGFAPSLDGLVDAERFTTSVVLRRRAPVGDLTKGQRSPAGTMTFRTGNDYETVTISVAAWSTEAIYTDAMVANSMKVGEDLPSNEIETAFSFTRELEDRYAFSGISGGQSADDSFSRSTRVVASGATAAWSAAASDAELAQLEAEFSALVSTPSNATDDRYPATRVALPLDVYNSLLAKRRANGVPVLEHLTSSYGVTAFGIASLKDAGSSGNTRAVAYSTNSEVGQHILLMPAELTNLVQGSEHYEQGVRTRSAGFYWKNPLGARYLDGV